VAQPLAIGSSIQIHTSSRGHRTTVAQAGGKDTVLPKRFDQQEDREIEDSGLAASETMRSAGDASKAERSATRDDERLSIFWRVFGGTILSIVALGSITLYNSVTSSIAELRTELNRERDARADLVKKEDLNSRTSNLYERLRSFDGLKAEHEALKERINSCATVLEAAKKDVAVTADAVKKDAAALEVFKERIAMLEAVKKEVAGLDFLKERLAAAGADLKSVRDDVAKLQHEVERNKVGDNERKASRDTQLKQLEESLKELQKGLQACREKLARLEGSQPGPSTRVPPVPSEQPAAGKPAAPPPLEN
jgi:archaellum component FlaC